MSPLGVTQALLDGSTINDQQSYLLSLCFVVEIQNSYSTLKVKSLKFDPVNNSSLKVIKIQERVGVVFTYPNFHLSRVEATAV